MKQKLPIIAIVVCLVAVAVACFFYKCQTDSPRVSEGLEKTGKEVKQRRDNTKLEKKSARLKEMKKKLSKVITASKNEPEIEVTGWENMAQELDKLLAAETVDEVAGKHYAEDAVEFIKDRKLDDTKATGAVCGTSMCRMSFEHSTMESFQEYQRHLVFSPWGTSSNYFAGESQDDDKVNSFVWVSREGHSLPMKEIRERNMAMAL